MSEMRFFRAMPFAALLAFCSASTAFGGQAVVEELPFESLKTQTLPKGGESAAFGFDSFWTASSGRLTRIRALDNAMSEIVLDTSGGPCRNIAFGEGSVWVPDCGKGVIYKLDPRTNTVALTITADMFSTDGSIGVGEGSVWVITAERGERTLTRFNASTGDVEATIALPFVGTSVLADFGSVWVTAASKGQLIRIDPRRNAILAALPLGGTPKGLASGEGSIWVMNEGAGVVQRVDGHTGLLTATINLGPRGADIAVGGGYVWITYCDAVLGQIDPRTNTLFRNFVSDYNEWAGGSVRFGGGSIWIAATRLLRVDLPRVTDAHRY
jgi:virginiamycin B lyase